MTAQTRLGCQRNAGLATEYVLLHCPLCGVGSGAGAGLPVPRSPSRVDELAELTRPDLARPQLWKTHTRPFSRSETNSRASRPRSLPSTTATEVSATLPPPIPCAPRADTNRLRTRASGSTVAKFAGDTVHSRLANNAHFKKRDWEASLKRAYLETDEDLRASESDAQTHNSLDADDQRARDRRPGFQGRPVRLHGRLDHHHARDEHHLCAFAPTLTPRKTRHRRTDAYTHTHTRRPTQVTRAR